MNFFPLTKKNGWERDFKLRDQILDATGSIMSNIAEGFARRGNAEFVRFLGYSKGSAEEVKSQLYQAMDRGYIVEKEFQSLYDQATVVGKKLGSLMGHLQRTDHKPDYTKKTNSEAA